MKEIFTNPEDFAEAGEAVTTLSRTQAIEENIFTLERFRNFPTTPEFLVLSRDAQALVLRDHARAINIGEQFNRTQATQLGQILATRPDDDFFRLGINSDFPKVKRVTTDLLDIVKRLGPNPSPEAINAFASHFSKAVLADRGIVIKGINSTHRAKSQATSFKRDYL